MSFKIAFACFLLVLVAFQEVTSLQMKNVNDQRSITDLFYKARESITKLKNLIEERIHHALDKLGTLNKKILSLVQSVVGKAKESILDEIQKVKNQIDKMKEQAAAVGVDVKECLSEYHDTLEDIPVNTFMTLRQCAKDEFHNSVNIIQNTVADVLQLKDLAENFSGHLKKCVINLNPVQCLGNLIGDVVDTISSIPSLLTGRLNDVVELVTHVEGNLKACAIRKVLDASKEAALVAAQVGKCVADKIRE